MNAPRPLPRAADDGGQVTAFVIGAFLGLWLFTGIVVDGGLALAGKTRAMDNAQEAARTGAQRLDLEALRNNGTTRLDPDRARAAARDYITATGDTAQVKVHGDAVTVHVTHRLHTQVLQLAGLSHLTVTGSATAHAERATTQAGATP
ncbi:pilus assembly protein TadG-related protein [Streptomyces sp. SBT349]|uniref:pilus assembly protein TadG-related protein n=1 Tax=Streptomyces sp. SBT349 TaxID=1580539 RepID=UPI00066BFD34|nr:pilus assembly protein TadG-related protein [Streptomyces sp. SBT349]